MKTMQKDLNLDRYKVWILDFDGTLYYQLPVRVIMGCWLLVYYLFHPSKIKYLFLLLEFRRLRESLAGTDFTNDVTYARKINELCVKYNVTKDDVEKIITIWTEERPCFPIKMFQRKRLLQTMRDHQKSGTLMVVYSDNPIQKKIKALSFKPDFCFDSNHEVIKCLKPNPQGLNNIVQYLGKRKENIIYIGDRDDRDGICAKTIGIKYFDVNELM